MLLCRVGPQQLAFEASGVQAIGTWEQGDGPVAQARVLFGLPPSAGKTLAGDGEVLVVDGVEVLSERLPRLPVPPAIAGAVGGALVGFIQGPNGLWPLFALAELARFLARGARA